MGTPRIAKCCKNGLILVLIMSAMTGVMIIMSPEFERQFISALTPVNTTEMENHQYASQQQDYAHQMDVTTNHDASYKQNAAYNQDAVHKKDTTQHQQDDTIHEDTTQPQQDDTTYDSTTLPEQEHADHNDASDEMEYSHLMPWLDRSDDVHETYLLSAFWDDRLDEPFISNLVLMRTAVELSDDVDMYCFVHCADADALNPQVFRANMTDIRTNKEYRNKVFDGTSFHRIIIPCKPRACRTPERVSLGYKMNSIGLMDRSNSIPVEYPSRGVQHSFGICVPPIFGCLNPYRVVEWMEMQKILGVGRVVIYNNSQCEETSRVLHEYGRQGLAEIRQDRVILNITNPDDEYTVRDELRTRSPLMMTDCMLRHMHDINFTYSVDFDEVLLPQKVESLQEMIPQIEEKFGNHFRQIIFTSFFMLKDNMLVNEPADDTFPAITQFLRYRKRLLPCDSHKRMKSMVWGDRCGYRNNHECRAAANKNMRYKELYLPADIAKVLHYRSTPCEIRNSTGIRCLNDVPPKPILKEDSMLRFQDKLIRNIRTQLNHLGMSIDPMK